MPINDDDIPAMSDRYLTSGIAMRNMNGVRASNLSERMVTSSARSSGLHRHGTGGYKQRAGNGAALVLGQAQAEQKSKSPTVSRPVNTDIKGTIPYQSSPDVAGSATQSTQDQTHGTTGGIPNDVHGSRTDRGASDQPNEATRKATNPNKVDYFGKASETPGTATEATAFSRAAGSMSVAPTRESPGGGATDNDQDPYPTMATARTSAARDKLRQKIEHPNLWDAFVGTNKQVNDYSQNYALARTLDQQEYQDKVSQWNARHPQDPRSAQSFPEMSAMHGVNENGEIIMLDKAGGQHPQRGVYDPRLRAREKAAAAGGGGGSYTPHIQTDTTGNVFDVEKSPLGPMAQPVMDARYLTQQQGPTAPGQSLPDVPTRQLRTVPKTQPSEFMGGLAVGVDPETGAPAFYRGTRGGAGAKKVEGVTPPPKESPDDKEAHQRAMKAQAIAMAEAAKQGVEGDELVQAGLDAYEKAKAGAGKPKDQSPLKAAPSHGGGGKKFTVTKDGKIVEN